MVKRVTTDRMILVDVVDRWFRLERPTFIYAGETYWIDTESEELCVDRGRGRVTRHAGSLCR